MANLVEQGSPGATHSAGNEPIAKHRRFELRSLGELGALIVLIIVFFALNPSTFLTVDNIRTILDQASTPLIVGVGATLVILMGSIDLSVEGIMGAAGMAYILSTLHTRSSIASSTDLGPLAFVIGIACAARLLGRLVR